MLFYSRPIIIFLLFGISRNVVYRYVNYILSKSEVQNNFEEQMNNRLNSSETWLNAYGESYVITSVVDGADHRIGNPFFKLDKTLNISGKKGYFTNNILFFVTTDGKTMRTSHSKPGSANDQGMMYEVDRDFIGRFDSNFEYIIGDKGFQGSDKTIYKNFLVPVRSYTIADKKGTAEYTRIKDSMKRFKSIRIIVENVFAQIRKWAIASQQLRFKLKSVHRYHQKIWRFLAFLVNLFETIRPTKKISLYNVNDESINCSNDDEEYVSDDDDNDDNDDGDDDDDDEEFEG